MYRIRENMLTCAESADTVIELKSHNIAGMIDNVGEAIPPTCHNFVSAVTLQATNNNLKQEQKKRNKPFQIEAGVHTLYKLLAL